MSTIIGIPEIKNYNLMELRLLGVTLDVRTLDIPGETKGLDDDEQGVAAVVAAEE
ncbi:hypothetical protein BDD12DRAFT_892099 [Trichophaea hybrida]|nr:hypothetical protein BDD12DRAFT_892099 [Trichophaea hybrida]